MLLGISTIKFKKIFFFSYQTDSENCLFDRWIAFSSWIRVFLLLMQAITMHMLSYAGRAEMQILVAKDIIPDPEFLAKCFEDALFEMKEAAIGTNKP